MSKKNKQQFKVAKDNRQMNKIVEVAKKAPEVMIIQEEVEASQKEQEKTVEVPENSLANENWIQDGDEDSNASEFVDATPNHIEDVADSDDYQQVIHEKKTSK